jgi:NAD(P)-dependent dehydrogenase (short-subunit alcohol dehydrogenase family)
MKILITGTTRGIGLELARQVLAAGHEVMAVAREPGRSRPLAELAARHGQRLRIVPFDLLDADVMDAVKAIARDWDCIDVLVNNAGILRKDDTRQDFMESFAVNAVVPFEMTRTLLPWLRKSTRPRALHVTSKMGSIADNSSGGHYAYRASKAALNMINRSLALDHVWLTTVVVHPGWVQTDMGGEEAPVAPADSAAGIWRLIEGLGLDSSGKFFDYQGNALPW